MAKSLKDRLLDLRESRKWYQKEIADKLNVSLNTYRSWENGQRKPKGMTLETLDRRIAEVSK